MITIKATNIMTKTTFVDVLPLNNPMHAVKYMKQQIAKVKRNKDNDNWNEKFWRMWVK